MDLVLSWDENDNGGYNQGHGGGRCAQFIHRSTCCLILSVGITVDTTGTRTGKTVATTAIGATVVVVGAEEEVVEAETRVTMAVMTVRVATIMAATTDGGTMAEGTVVTTEAEAGEVEVEVEVTIGITTTEAVTGRLRQTIPLILCRLVRLVPTVGRPYHPHHQQLYVSLVLDPSTSTDTVTQGPPDDRLDQARKVQQLLAALKQPQGGPPGAATPPTMHPGPPPIQPNAPYYSQPPPGGMPPYPGSMPPPSTYAGVPPTPPPGSTGAGANGLPPNIMALLQQAQSRPPGAPGAGALPYGMPPGPPPNGVPPAQYQQLMSYLVCFARSSLFLPTSLMPFSEVPGQVTN